MYTISLTSTRYIITLKVTQNEEIKMKSLNGACLFAYEVHRHRILPAKNELEDPKSLPDIQRSIINGKLINLILPHIKIHGVITTFLQKYIPY